VNPVDRPIARDRNDDRDRLLVEELVDRRLPLAQGRGRPCGVDRDRDERGCPVGDRQKGRQRERAVDQPRRREGVTVLILDGVEVVERLHVEIGRVRIFVSDLDQTVHIRDIRVGRGRLAKAGHIVSGRGQAVGTVGRLDPVIVGPRSAHVGRPGETVTHHDGPRDDPEVGELHGWLWDHRRDPVDLIDGREVYDLGVGSEPLAVTHEGDDRRVEERGCGQGWRCLIDIHPWVEVLTPKVGHPCPL
jgi:hypothetical protein